MRSGLTLRLLIAAGIVVAFLVVVFALVVHAFEVVQSATTAQHRSDQTVLAAGAIDNDILELQAGARGYILTSNPVFLDPWISGKNALPADSARLLALAPGPGARAITVAAQHYLQKYSIPFVTLARTNPAGARAEVKAGRGSHAAVVRRMLARFVDRQRAIAQSDLAHVRHEQRVGIVTAIVGVVVTVLLFAAMVGYFLAAAVGPLRRLATATARVSSGDLDVTVPEQGAGEVGQLAIAFNEMARSLARQRSSLAEQNVDLERLAYVLRAVLDSTVDGILLSDAAGEVQLANRPLVTMARDFGMSFEGSVPDRLLSVADRMQDPEAFRAAMEKLRDNPDEPTFNEFEEANSGRVFQGWTASVRDDAGAFVGRIWTLREVTQQRELDRLKDDFVATVSHELRTPLTSMMGFLQMIRDGEAGELTPEQERFLAIVYRSSERLQRLVGDLLFVARLDASGLQMHFEPVQLDRLMHDAVESVSGLARSHELDLELELEPVPDVSGDRERLMQLLGNLLSNALKFTPAGGTVTARTFVEDGYVVGEVEDTGIGIPVAEQERLFQRFFRSSTATAQAIPGTGLGLVISKAIAEAHGGTIGIRSEPGRGTSFRVELPIEGKDEE